MSSFAHKMLDFAFFVAPAVAFRLNQNQQADYNRLQTAKAKLQSDLAIVSKLSGKPFKDRAARLSAQLAEIEETIIDLQLSARLG